MRHHKNTMAAYLRFIISAAALLGACLSAKASDHGTAGSVGRTGISGEVLAFIDDIEYSTAWRSGATMFGASAVFRFFYEPSERLQFAAGAYGLRRFGDERFFSRALPVFRARYITERLEFILGELIADSAHGLPDILYRQEYLFDPGIEEGIQLRAQRGHVRADLWVHWDSLNTPENREHFTAGFVSELSFDNISFPLAVVAGHSGGELYEIPGQPVQDRLGAAAGVAAAWPVNAAVRRAIGRVFGQVLAVGSAYRVRSGQGETGSGHGILCRAGISPFDFDLSALWFKGRDLLEPAGDPLYRSNRPVYALEAARNYSMNDRVTVSGGIRFETEGCSFRSYFSNPRYRWWISMRGGFERRTRRE
ncbi:MAG: hypothetical protein JW699_06225 [Chitinispirillaceae bacterium]|nr:hypothetical protein [Chitinispirillaceae bacterium]